MVGLARIEVRRLLRQPGGIALLLVSAALFYAQGVPEFSASFPEGLTTIARAPLTSFAEWGRMLLLVSTSAAGGLFALFASLITTNLLHAESTHVDVIGSTIAAASYRAAWARLATTSLFVFVVIVVGAASAWFNPANREFLSLGGAEFLPLYLGLLWLQTMIWVGLSMLLYHVTHSRWIPIAVVTVVGVGWYILGLGHFLGPLVGLLHRGFLAWGFVHPYTPLGLVPGLLGLQAAATLGLASLLLAAVPWARRTAAAWRRLRPRFGRTALAAAGILTIGSLVASAWLLDTHMGEPSAASPLETHIDATDLWSHTGAFVRHPSPFAMVRLPLEQETPAWLSDPEGATPWVRHDRVGNLITARSGAIWTTYRESLVLGLPIHRAAPAELLPVAESFLQRFGPMVERTELWRGPLDIVFLPPYSGLREFEVSNGVLLVPLSRVNRHAGRLCAQLLAEDAPVTGPERVVVYLYLLEASDPAELAVSIERLRAYAEGTLEPRDDFPWLVDPLHRWDEGWGPRDAERIVALWQQGDAVGHDQVVRKLLEGDAP